MVWDPTAPASGASLQSAPVRANFAALDTSVMAPLTALSNGAVLTKAGGVVGGVAPATNGQVLTLVSGAPAWQAPGGGLTGTTGTYPVTLESATFPDGSGTINDPAELVRHVSTGTPTTNTPKRTQTIANFDAATDEHLCWAGVWPVDWGAGGTLRLKWRAATATSGSVIWKAGISFGTESATNDTAVVYNAADLATATAAPGTLGQLVETTIALTMTNAAPRRQFSLFIGRDADNGGDTMAGDAVLLRATLEYTRA